MSHYVPIPVSHWDIKRTKKHGEEGGGGGGGGEGGGGGGGGGVSHLRNHSNCEVAELTWENGQLAMHGLGGLIRPNPSKPDSNRKPESKLNWDHTGGTLESVVHQVPNHYHEPDDVVGWFSDYAQTAGRLRPASSAENDRNQAHIVPVANSLVDHSRKVTINQSGRELAKTGTWPEYGLPPLGLVDMKANRSVPPPSSEELADTKANGSVSMSGSATFGKEADTTLMTWASFESPTSMRTNCTDKADCTSKCKRKSEADADEDWACRGGRQRNPEEERDNKGKSGRSLSSSTKRSRAAAVHNQSERRRRDRINQRMKALQKLVPNSSKTDKASMLDEVIEYLKQLQTQLQMMSIRSMPHMMMPMGLQQQLQMSYMARMGMGMGLGMGMGMMDMSPVGHAATPTIPPLIHPATAAAAFVPPPLVAPPLIPTTATRNANLDPISSPSTSMPDPYSTFLAQSMNLDLYHKMTALYQQMHQPGHANSPPHINGNLKE